MALSISEIANASKLDLDIAKAVKKIIQESWEATNKNVFYSFRVKLSTLGSMMLRGEKIVIPLNLRPQTLEIAQEGHRGETVMKRRLRAKVWRLSYGQAAEQTTACFKTRIPRGTLAMFSY